MRTARHLVIFARLPRLGTGKRRLAKDIGATEALRFQRLMLANLTRRLGSDRRWITWLAVTPDRSSPWPRGIDTVPQGGGDLGQRMARVARNLPPGPVVIVGTDIPELEASDIEASFRALGSKTAVFGPATDGGYWLVGLRRQPKFINPFVNVRWSSKHALADTIANLSGEPVGTLRTLSDIDDGAAWQRFLRSQSHLGRVQ